MPGRAAETEPALEAPAAKPLGPSMQNKRSISGQGRLSCVYEDQQSTDVHVVLCSFEDSEGCVLTNPTPLRVLIRRYDAVRILMIGSTSEGCSRVTFTGSVKKN